MEFAEALRIKVKPELNNIYVDPPFQTPTGIDFGWYCREHALHLYVLAKLFGYDVSMCLGDFYINSPDEGYIESMTTDCDHAWCSINNVCPVDISMTLRHIFKSPDIPIVYGHSNNNESNYEILYYEKEDNSKLMNSFNRKSSFIAYNQKDVLQYDPIKLLEEPYSFLLPVPAGHPTLQKVYGHDFFYRITYHCYKLIIDEDKKPFYYRNPKESIRAMIKFNENAKIDMTIILDNRSKKF